MKLHIKMKYYKRSQVGREPVRFDVKQPKGVGTDIYGEVKLDPVLRKKANVDLRKALIGHELTEIKAWGTGQKGIHRRAMTKEPELTRSIGGVSGFWKEIKRREHRR